MNSHTQAMHQNRGLSIFLGILLIIGGLIALSSKVLFSVTTFYLFGWILLVSGAAQFFGSFFSGSWSRFFILLLTGVLSFIVGAVIIINPAISIGTIAVLLGVVFMIDGIFKIATSISMRTDNWGWRIAYGIVVFLLGLYMFTLGPIANLWILGLIIGFQLILSGVLMIANAYTEPQTSHRMAY